MDLGTPLLALMIQSVGLSEQVYDWVVLIKDFLFTQRVFCYFVSLLGLCLNYLVVRYKWTNYLYIVFGRPNRDKFDVLAKINFLWRWMCHCVQ